MSRKDLLLKGVRVFICALLALPAAFSQFETAAVLGTVEDPRGAAVRDAQVTLLNQETGVAQHAATDAEGNYHFLEAKAGRYVVRVEAPGFKRAGTAEFRVSVSAHQRVD